MFDQLTTILTTESSLILTLTFFTTIIVVYALFVFYFYRFLAKKNIIELNLAKYNTYSAAALVKIVAVIFYIIEYIILLPVITFFWYIILAILILILAKGIELNLILLLSAALVASVRITSYINEDLSKDLAKMLPFTLLAIAITTAGFFNVSPLLERVTQIPTLLSSISHYLIFIIIVELIMRIIDFLRATFTTAKATEDGTEE